jgi:hypothetical protein
MPRSEPEPTNACEHGCPLIECRGPHVIEPMHSLYTGSLAALEHVQRMDRSAE